MSAYSLGFWLLVPCLVHDNSVAFYAPFSMSVDVPMLM